MKVINTYTAGKYSAELIENDKYSSTKYSVVLQDVTESSSLNIWSGDSLREGYASLETTYKMVAWAASFRYTEVDV